MVVNKTEIGAEIAGPAQPPIGLPVPINEVRVGMGDIVVARAPGTLSIVGLGSCVGVALYHPRSRVGGLAHVMLPDSSKSKSSTSREKFADTGLAILLERLKKEGAEASGLSARLAGGAHMFKFSGGAGNAVFNIGDNNVSACREFLRREHIRIAGEDVLGTTGRTMRFDLATGRVWVRYADGSGIEL